MPIARLGHTNRRHGWLPKDQEFIKKYIRDKIREAKIIFKDGERDDKLHPIMKSWINLIENDPQANIYFTNMFTELPENASNELLALGITDYKTMIRVIDVIISEAPKFITNGTDIVGVPIYLVLNYVINTPDGMNAFFYDKANVIIFKVIETWEDYLALQASASVLNEGPEGWLSPTAISMFEERDGKPFDQMYVCDKSLPHWGFGSWDHFFVRELREGARPVDTDPTHVVSGCESAVFRIATDVQVRDEFWLKKPNPLFSYPYSLFHMLNGNEKYVSELEGGTVFQAFLSPFDYHRWHSPVDGVIEKIDLIPGTYYAAVAGSADQNGGGALINSQSFLTAVAARCVFYIRTTAPDIGLIAFLPIGMAEVSTCHVTVREGIEVKKGQELGMFHFGGSSSAIVFNKDTDLQWLQGIVDAQGNYVPDVPTKINTGIAVAKKKAPQTRVRA